MKRAFIAIAILLLLAGGIVSAIPLFISSDTVRSRILGHLQELTGQAVAFRGNPSVSLKPFLGIEITDLVITDPTAKSDEAPLLKVEVLRGKLDLLPALTGDAEITEYELTRPRLNLRAYSEGKNNWTFDKGNLHRILQQAETSIEEETAQPDGIRLGEFKILDGQISYENKMTGHSESVSNINGDFSWKDTQDSVLLQGSGVWQGETVKTEMQIENLMALLAGAKSDLEVVFASTPLEFEFSGSASMHPDLYLIGKLNSSSPSLPRVFELLDLRTGYFGQLDNVEASGMLNASAEDMTLSEAKISIGENDATGVVRLSRNEGGFKKFDGTLAFDDIDATRFMETTSGNHEIVETNITGDFQVDLRLSANSISAESISLTDVAAAITMKEDDWVFDIGDSQTLGGRVIAKLGERTENEKRLLFLELSASEIDAGNLSEFLNADDIEISGTADIDASLRSSAMSWRKMIRNLNGELAVHFINGEIKGIDLPQLLQAQADENGIARPLDETGVTEFASFTAKTFINRGVASVSKGLLQSDEIDVQLFGNTDLYAGSLALTAQQVSEGNPSPNRLLIGGTFKVPLTALERGPGNEEAPKSKASDIDNDTSVSN